MAKVIYVSADGNRTEVEIEPGETIMSLAVNHLVDGIVGECGGALACATCHCYMDTEYTDHFASTGEMEAEMLELAIDKQDNSRLSCQLELSDDIQEDIVVHLPASQA